jgi:hypothetical protein
VQNELSEMETRDSNCSATFCRPEQKRQQLRNAEHHRQKRSFDNV